MKKCPYCGRQCSDEMSVCPIDATPLVSTTPEPAAPPVYVSPSNTPGTGLSVASLAMGITSIATCLGPLLGIPAVICGHLALSRIKKYPAQVGGRGMAIGGLVTGYIGITLIFFSIALLLPALAQAQRKVKQFNCVDNLKQVGLATKVWALDHDNTLPRHLIDITNELGMPRVLVCPADTGRVLPPVGTAFGWDPNNVTYELLTPGMPLDQSQHRTIIRCPIHGTELLGDGTVKIVPGRR